MRNRSGMNPNHNHNNSESHRRCLRSRSISKSDTTTDEGTTTAVAAASVSDEDDDTNYNNNNEDVELRSLLSGDREGDGGGSSLSLSLPLNNPRRPLLDKQHLITHLTAATIASSTNENHEINGISSRRNKCVPRCSAITLFLFMVVLGIMFLMMGGPLLDHANANNNNRSSSLSSTTSLWAPSSNNNNNRHGDKHHHLSNYNGNANNNDDGDSNNNNNMKRMPYRMVDYAHVEDDQSQQEQQQQQQQQQTWKNWFGKKNVDTTATNTGKKKFDRINDTKKQKKKQQQQGSMTKIKEAIDNLDRVFMDKHPDAQQQEEEENDGAGDDVMKKNKKKKKRQQGGDANLGDGGDGGADDDSVDSILADSDTNNNGDGGGGDEDSTIVIGGVPLVHDTEDDDALNANADALDAYARTLPASDALECRASVVAFVINATDVKDECDGLRKAFDKACSVQAQTQSQTQQQQPNLVRQRRILQKRSARRRVLSEWGRPQVSNLIPEAFHGYLQKWMVGPKVGVEVTRRLANSWLEFSDGDVDTKALRGGVEWRRLEGIYVEDEEVEGGVVEDELDDESSTALQQEEKKQDPAVVVPPPIISLNIPTENEHLSEQMLNDALLLQDTEMLQAGAVAMAATPPISVVDSPPDQLLSKQQQPPPALSSNSAISGDSASNPSNNVTVDTQVAVQDAAESAEAIRTAVEGVKSMMNDPKSVEARTCCASILSVFHEHCDPTTKGVEDYSDQRLLVVVFVITVCGIIKSMIRHLNIRWLPEAGGCILVGVFGYLILQRMPHVRFAFDGDMFLRIMVPPIVFEAAVKINKQSFRRHVIPITIFAIVGTLASTAFTAFILHKGSSMFGGYVPTIPPRESLIFGALISSIDPIAVLSVLSNMGMTDSDTIYVLIFGESLLNDGVAIVLFQTLVHFLDESLVIDSDVVLDATMHFVVVALGSISVGIASGVCATLYFSLMHGCQTPMVEVIVFCCFSFIPYYICDLVEWSGIVAIVANGFVMDLYVIGQTHMKQPHQHVVAASSTVDSEIDFLVNGSGNASNNTNGTPSRRYKQQQCRSAFTYEGHLSPTADSHVHFVIEIFATLMETAIFAYLGLFLFSSRYHWNGYLTVLSIFATVMGRVLMIPLLSHVANVLNRMRVSRQRQRYPTGIVANINDEVHIDRRMQLVLVFAGLRGAMSFALVEHIPMFDTTTGQGSRLKPELKAMTSASVIFTLFVLGGATSYLMERLGYSLNMQQGQQNSVEIVSLLQNHEKRTPSATERKSNGVFPQANDIGLRTNGKVRQRGSNKT